MSNSVTRQLELQTNTFTEIGAGLNYIDETSKSWRRSVDRIDIMTNGISGGGAAALQGPTKVYFSPTLGNDAVITLVTASNTVVKISPLALYYYDPASGKTALLASVRDQAEGELIGPNVVVYKSAFEEDNGLKADIRFTYTHYGFESDVIIQSAPAKSPEAFGLNSATTKLELLHLISGSTPRRTPQAVKADLTDETLDYGDILFPAGYAFSVADSSDEDFPPAGMPAPIRFADALEHSKRVPVGKRWLQIGNKSFLAEDVDWEDIKPKLDGLPRAQQGAGLSTTNRQASFVRQLPTFSQHARGVPKPMRLASATYKPRGVVLDYDYTTVIGGSGWVFVSGNTYYVSSPTSLGSIVFNPNCYIKLAANASLVAYTSVTCNGDKNNPTVLTSIDDWAYGVHDLPGSTGYPPTSANNIALKINRSSYGTLKGLKIRFAYLGVQFESAPGNVVDCSFEFCSFGVYAINCGLNIAGDKCSIGADFVPGGGYIGGSFTQVCTGTDPSNGFQRDWEYKYFGGTGVDPNDDPDVDGRNNQQEYDGLTNPRVDDRPSIQVQPLAQTVVQGNAVTFNVAATGTGYLSYQWTFNDAIIAGATSPSFSINSAQLANSGNYSVTVANDYGSTTSAEAFLSVAIPGGGAPPPGIVAWWPGNDANDIIGGNNGTLHNGAQYAQGEVGQAFSFAGLSDYMSAPDSTSLRQSAAMSLECWVYINAYPSGDAVLVLGKDSTSVHEHQIALVNTSGHWCFRGLINVGGTLYLASGAGTPSPNTWNHVAMTFDGLTLKSYLNGTLDASTSISGSIALGSDPFLIGGYGTGPWTLNGRVDEAALYNRALSESEILGIFRAGGAGKNGYSGPPSLTGPDDLAVVAGATANFSVNASGTGPFSYQWMFNGSVLSGKTQSTCSIPNVQAANVGSYYVVVANSGGSVLSRTASLAFQGQCSTPPAGLVAWWPAEENANDIAGANNGIFSGSYTADGKVGKAFTIDSGAHTVRIPASSAINVGSGAGFTVEGWVNTGYAGPFVEWGAGQGYGVHIWPNFRYSGCVWVNLFGTDNLSRTFEATGFTPGVFQHLALTYDKISGNAKLYINGNLSATSPVGSNFTPETSTDLYLGYRPYGGGFLSGSIDEVSLYNRALSGEDIQAIFNAGTVGKCRPPPAPPTITVQPIGHLVEQGGTAAFTVTAAGATAYQWRKNGLDIPGATGASYTKADVQLVDAGLYSVYASNSGGGVTSFGADLTVFSPPIDQTTTEEDDITFSVTSSGTLPLTYQWRKDGVNIVGETGPSLLLTYVQVWDAADYSVQVSDTNGTAISSSATLTVNGAEGAYIILTGTRQDCTLKGNFTYYIPSGTVTLVGTTHLEGGAVIKYAPDPTTKLVINGTLDLQTGPYRPAIFTARDDDSTGFPINESTGQVSGRYAGVALELASATATTLKHIRICHANTAIHYQGAITAEVTDTVRHIQLRDCALGINSEGTASYARVLSLGNILMSHVDQAIGGSRFRGRAEHLTVDTCATLAQDDAPNSRAFYLANCVLADVTSMGSGLALDGSNNGFYPQTTHQLGSGEMFETATPFAPTTFIDPQYGEFYNPENGQGAYYLRAESPFFDAGTPNVDASLKNELGQMTASVPPRFLWQDLTTSQTLGPQPIRDQGSLDLGYHYPAVDYVISGATVNNCTLNIDPGTVLAFVGYWPWGLRVNAGGRLNVNGVPTNHVVFAHLAAIQESPILEMAPIGPMLTFRDLFFFDTPARPLPQAKLLYADFPTVSGGFDPEFSPGWNLSIGPLASVGYFALPDYANHGTLGNLEINGCLFQGGEFYYEAGGPQDRAIGVTNSVFERCTVSFMTSYGYAGYTGATEYDPQVAAVNNLWYDCYMKLVPVGSDNNWIFSDNIFDRVIFDSYWSEVHNGPIAHNDHNAYISMSGYHLAPVQNADSDPDLTALAYQSGALGRFYLPQNNTGLINKGSRSAGLAGLYHFTTSTSNAKEAASMVDIGPHYLALDAANNPFDSNAGGPDGIPDFIADRDGDGIANSDEVPWAAANNGPLAILAPLDSVTVEGIVRLSVNLGANATAVNSVYALVDGRMPPDSQAVNSPAQKLDRLEFDTRFLDDGPHHCVVAAYTSAAANGSQTRFSGSINFNTANSTRYPHWQARADQYVKLNLKVPSSTQYELWFYGHNYAKSYSDVPLSIVPIQSGANGSLSYSAAPLDLGYEDGNTDPTVYSFTGLASAGTVTTAIHNPNIQQEIPWPDETGWWAAAYADDVIDWDYVNRADPSAGWTLIADKSSHRYNPFTLTDTGLWLHDNVLNAGWWLCGDQSSAGQQPTLAAAHDPNWPDWGQTWPIRMYSPTDSRALLHYVLDAGKLLEYLGYPGTRNFYGHSHGNPYTFFNISSGELYQRVNHRFRFVFLDGCSTANGNLFCAFGATDEELTFPVYPPEDVSPLRQIDLTYYTQDSGLRPGAFMGWKADSYSSYLVLPPGTTDDRTHTSGCRLQCYEAMCNWHGELLASWIFGSTLLEAIEDANQWTMSQGSDPPVYGNLTTKVVSPDGTVDTVVFLPSTCLRVYGYGSIKFNEYNHYPDWPPP